MLRTTSSAKVALKVKCRWEKTVLRLPDEILFALNLLQCQSNELLISLDMLRWRLHSDCHCFNSLWPFMEFKFNSWTWKHSFVIHYLLLTDSTLFWIVEKKNKMKGLKKKKDFTSLKQWKTLLNYFLLTEILTECAPLLKWTNQFEVHLDLPGFQALSFTCYVNGNLRVDALNVEWLRWKLCRLVVIHHSLEWFLT